MKQKINITTDILLFGYSRKRARILLIERKYPPFQGCWALPGGFVENNESLHDAACRELKEETGVEIKLNPAPFYVDTPDRDPRGRVITAVFWGIVTLPKVKGGSDAGKAHWFPINQLPSLAFDHREIINITNRHIQLLYDNSLPLLANAKAMKVEKLMEIIENIRVLYHDKGD